jgi:hypothetical protein
MALIAAGGERQLMADLRRPVLGTADPEPASQNVVLNVSKVAMNSPAGAPGIGHKAPFIEPAQSRPRTPLRFDSEPAAPPRRLSQRADAWIALEAEEDVMSR